MKSAASLVVLASSAAAFSPSISHRSSVTSLAAKHANNKAAKKANHNRPRKSRPSDIHRTPVVYDEIVKPPEYTIVDNGSSPESLPEEVYVQAKFGNNLGMIMTGDEHTGWVAKAGSFVQGTFEPIDWANMPQTNAVSNEPAEDDVLSWLNAQDHETAMAWIQNKIDTVEPVKLSKEEFETKLEENQVGDVNEIKERIMAASGENTEGGEDEGTSDGFNLPEGAELMDVVDDQLYIRKFLKNPLMARKQVGIEMVHSELANVSQAQIKAQLATMFKAKEESISVVGLHTKFGGGRSSGMALIYDNLDAKKRYDSKMRLHNSGLVLKKAAANRKQKKDIRTKRSKLRGIAKAKVTFGKKKK